jgi:uncharacterized RDD family membrane protein YckC
MTIDTRYTVNTPEGVSLELSPAGPSIRFWAWFLDILIRTAINALIFGVLGGFLGKTGLGISLILAFLLEWFYPVFFEIRRKGQTPGKNAMNIYVAHEDGTPISLPASIIRNLIRFVDFLPFAYGFGLMSMLLNQRFKRLGDLVAGTVVLHKNSTRKESHSDQENIAAIRPPLAFSLKEQQNIINFSQRRKNLSEARADELALLAGEWMENGQDKATSSAEYLSGIAAWLEGKTSGKPSGDQL